MTRHLRSRRFRPAGRIGASSVLARGRSWGRSSLLLASVMKRGMNFTNLGGVGRSVCFLKNVNGMWLLRECMDEWEERGTPVILPKLLQECEALPAPGFL